jgi:hypothetical protein
LKYVNALQPFSLRQWADPPTGEGETLLSLFDKSKIHELTKLETHPSEGARFELATLL